MKKTITFIFLATTLILLSQISNVYAQNSTNQADDCPNNETNGYPITFEPGSYTGNYFVVNLVTKKSKRCVGDRILNLPVGQHLLWMGWNGQENLIYFKVEEGGSLSVPIHADAFESFKDGKFIFKNVSIVIDPQLFPDFYYPSPYNLLSEQRQSGKQTFTLVPNLKYFVEIYGRGTNDELLFHVGEEGVISGINNLRAATAAGNTLKFENRNISVTSPDYKGKIMFGGIERQMPINSMMIVPYMTIPIFLPGNSKNELLIRMSYMIVPDDMVLTAAGKSKKSFTFLFNCDSCAPRTK